MELNDFVKNFAAQFEETDASEFKPDTEYKLLEEWSSMTSLTIIAMIDDVYHVQIKGAAIQNADTIEDLFNQVKVLVP